MRFGGLIGAVLLVASACSAGATQTLAAPSVSIDSVDVSGSDITMLVTAGADGSPVTISVSWGDGEAEPDIEGTGEFAYSHTYGIDIDGATISVTAENADGTVASAIAQVVLEPPSSTTTVVALGTTTTTVPDTTTTLPPTTTTTLPPTTTTTAPPTTTSSTTSTSSTTTTAAPPTTTTTTIPEPTTVEVEIDVSTGTILDRWGSGIKESTWNGSMATVTVARHADSWETDGIAVAFTIPASTYDDLKDGATSLEFEYVVLPLAEYTLDTDKLDGNAAEVKWEFMGAFDTTWSSNAKGRSAVAARFTTGKSGDPFIGSWVLEPINFGAPQRVHMFFQCRAKGPGGLIVGSDSKCDASLKVNAITVAITANR